MSKSKTSKQPVITDSKAGGDCGATICSVNINYHPEYANDPDWQQMTKDDYMKGFGVDEYGWRGMLAAGAIVK